MSKMENQITLEKLAEKLNGKMWVKGDLKRIYLDKGHNTKKMSTKTFVWQNEAGEFKVSCKVDCPSQPSQWEISQENEVKESVYSDIEKFIELEKIALVEARLSVDETEVEVRISYNGIEETQFISEYNFDKRFNTYPENVFKNLPKTKIIVKPIVLKEEVREPKLSSITDVNSITFGVNTKVKHPKFNIGIILEENSSSVVVDFGSEIGTKSLLKRFAPLEVIND